MYMQILCTVALVFFNYGNAHDTNQTQCINFKNSTTWPDSVMEDLDECQREAQDADIGEIQNSSGMGGRGDITTKIKGFLQKVWNRFIKTLRWEENKISILNCMWSNQKLFNVETKEVQWDNIINLIRGLKIDELRKDHLLEALAECRTNETEILKTFKCFFTHELTKTDCPFSSKTPWQTQRQETDI